MQSVVRMTLARQHLLIKKKFTDAFGVFILKSPLKNVTHYDIMEDRTNTAKGCEDICGGFLVG